MRYIYSTIFIAVFISINSCNTIKVLKLIKKGEVVQQNFNQIIAYQEFRNWILIDVKINGSEKTYKFLFDTGAVTLVTPELAKALGLKVKAEQNVGSSTDAKQKTGFSQIDNINIGGIDFKDVGVAIIRLDQSPDISCLGVQIDGFIGANLMKHAIWQIDYQNKTLQFTDNLKNIEIRDSHYILPFTTTAQGTPKIKVPLFGKEIKASFDTGKSGSIDLNKKHFKDVNFEHDSVAAVKGFGVSGSGVFGSVEETVHIVRVNNFEWNGLKTDSMYIGVAERTSNLVGNQFFNNFRVTANWQNNTLTLEPYKSENKSAGFRSFGYNYSFRENKLYVSFLLENSPAQKANIPLNSQILSVNGENCEKVTIEEYCAMRLEASNAKEIKTVQLKYKTPTGEIKEVKLEKKQLL